MKINISVLKQRRGDKYSVYLALTGGGKKREVIYSGHAVPVDHWSKKTGMPKATGSAAYLAIAKMKGDLNTKILQMLGEHKVVTPFSLKQQFLEKLGNSEADQDNEDRQTSDGKNNVIKLAEAYIENKLFKYKYNTRKCVKCNVKFFMAFLKDNGFGKLERKNLNMQIIEAFEKSMVDDEYAINARGTKMKHLKWFLSSIDFDTSKIKVATMTTTIVSLTLEELELLENVNVSHDSQWQRAKDMWLLGAYTGLRISDLKQLNPITTKGDTIQLLTTKNQKFVKIPIQARCNEILKRYGNAAPKFPEQKVNEYIKLVCKEAKINEPTIVEYSKGNEKFKKTVPKHDLITTHIAGKTFITLAPELWKMAPEQIAYLIGKDPRTLYKHYFKADAQAAIGRQKMLENDRPLMKVS